MKTGIGIVLLLVFSAGIAELCPDLKEAQKREAALAALSAFHLYECGDLSIADAMKAGPPSPFARMLYDYTCKVANANPSVDKVLDALNRRKASMTGPKILEADLSRAVAAGSPDAPVVLVGYVCTRCPLCKFLTPLLYKDVTEGQLKGKVKFYYRPFPVKTHPHSAEGALAAQAAARMGKPWEYLLLLYRNFDNFSVEKLPVWAADSLQLDRKAFDAARASAQVNASVVESKKEGFKNNVIETPTFFVNGRKYTGFMNYQSLLDVLLEEYGRAEGKLCVE
jgi:protein-disulfide isomerase